MKSRSVALFLRGQEAARAQLIFGNGASELIDLLARAAPQGKYSARAAVQHGFRLRTRGFGRFRVGLGLFLLASSG